MGSIAAIVSDTHTNDRMGLSLPTYTHKEGNTHGFNIVQERMLEWHYDFRDNFLHLAKGIPKKNRWLVLNGDIMEGDVKKRQHKILSRIRSEIIDQAQEWIEEIWLPHVGQVLFVQGTAAHTGKGSDFEEDLASRIKAIPDPKRNTRLWQSYYGYIDGVLLDIKHETKVGQLPWTFENIVNRDTYRMEEMYWHRREEIPALAIRGHVHKFYPHRQHELGGQQGESNYVQTLISGCWKGVGDWENHKFIEPPDWGSWIIKADNGRWWAKKYQYKLDARKPYDIG